MADDEKKTDDGKGITERRISADGDMQTEPTSDTKLGRITKPEGQKSPDPDDTTDINAQD